MEEFDGKEVERERAEKWRNMTIEEKKSQVLEDNKVLKNSMEIGKDETHGELSETNRKENREPAMRERKTVRIPSAVKLSSVDTGESERGREIL